MRYLKIRRGKSQLRKDGTQGAVPLIVTKTKKFGKELKQETITRKKPILITGGHDSGKSYWLTRLCRESSLIWAKYKDHPLFLDPVRPLMSWSENPAVVAWWGLKQSESEDDLPPWSKLKAYERQEKLADYLSESKSILFIDNAHKLTGRKLQIAKECLIASNIYVLTTTDEERLPPSIRHMILKRHPQIIRLGTETAYDATQLLVFLFALVSLGAGWWEISLVLGGLTALSKSKRSSRQE